MYRKMTARCARKCTYKGENEQAIHRPQCLRITVIPCDSNNIVVMVYVASLTHVDRYAQIMNRLIFGV